MTIETKCNIRDVVSYRPQNPVLSLAVTSTVCGIYIHISDDDDIAVNYRMSNGDTVGESRILPK